MGKYSDIEKNVEHYLNICLDILNDVNKYNNDSQVIIDNQNNSFKRLIVEHIDRCTNEINTLENMIDSKKRILSKEAREKDIKIELEQKKKLEKQAGDTYD